MGADRPGVVRHGEHQPDLPGRPLLRRHLHGPRSRPHAPRPHPPPRGALRLLAPLQPLRAVRPHGHRTAGALLLPRLGSVDSGKVRSVGGKGRIRVTTKITYLWDLHRMQ